MSKKLSLKLEDFQSNVSKTFSQLRSEEEFFDVSLVSDDEKMMSAHKLVLSASSPYFKHILTTNKHSHPLLCLDGVSSAELQCVLDYIYQGEVQIYQEQLDRFLVVAQRLKLEGLVSQDDEQEKNMKNETADYQENPLRNVYETEEPQFVNREDLKSETSVSKRRPKRSSSVAMSVPKSFSEGNVTTQEINEKTDEYLIRGEDGLYSCGLCGKAGDNSKRNMRNHVETHLEGLSFPCQNCQKVFRSRNSLNVHKSMFHRL